jgi:hypothetical protein
MSSEGRNALAFRPLLINRLPKRILRRSATGATGI